MKVVNKKEGELLVSFLQLKADRTKTGPQGVTAAELASAIQDPAPKGLGLKFTWASE